MKALPASLVFVALAVVGCADRSGPRIYRGDYFYNFESATFTPEGGSEPWCVNASKLKAAEPPPDGTPGGPWGTTQVVVRGVLSEKGSYCNLGAYKYFLDVTEVVEVHSEKQSN